MPSSRMPVLASGLLITAMAACSRDVSVSHARRIEAGVRPVLDAMCGEANGSLDPQFWPQVVSELQPESVRLVSEGIYIQTSSFFVESSGIFVPCHPGEFTFNGRVDPSFRRLSETVFRYDITG
jgi:hypothetical protein